MRVRPRFVALQGALFAVLVAGPLAVRDGGQVGHGRRRRCVARACARTPALCATRPCGRHGRRARHCRAVAVRGRDERHAGRGAARSSRPPRRRRCRLGRGRRPTTCNISWTLSVRASTTRTSVSRWSSIAASDMELDVRMPKTVSVMYGGHPTAFVTTAATWSQALAGVGLPLGSTAELSVDPTSAPMDGRRWTSTSPAPGPSPRTSRSRSRQSPRPRRRWTWDQQGGLGRPSGQVPGGLALTLRDGAVSSVCWSPAGSSPPRRRGWSRRGPGARRHDPPPATRQRAWTA